MMVSCVKQVVLVVAFGVLLYAGMSLRKELSVIKTDEGSGVHLGSVVAATQEVKTVVNGVVVDPTDYLEDDNEEDEDDAEEEEEAMEKDQEEKDMEADINIKSQKSTTRSNTKIKKKDTLKPKAKTRKAPQPSDINLDSFRLCRIQPPPVLGQKPVVMSGLAMPLDFQCSGEPYQQFSLLLKEFIRHKAAKSLTSKWGRHKSILPQNPTTTTKEGRSLLIMGNSHTRQVASTLFCQYKDQMQSFTTLYSMPQYPQNGVFQVELHNNITIYAAVNCPFVYTTKWQSILEDNILKRPLNSLSAIVVGKFNSYSESTGTEFYKMIMSYQKEYPKWELDFEHYPGPTVRDIAKAYQSGPLIYTGMFAKYGDAKYMQAKQMMLRLQAQESQQSQQSQSQPTRFKYIHGRRYIVAMEELQGQMTLYSTKYKPVHECSSDVRGKVATCVTNTSSTRFSNGHRCMGAHGGHADLLVWDVVTALHKMVPTVG